MYDLKPLSRDGIPAAIQKAERYRFLNQPWAAESICLDVLAADPENQQVLVVLLLALTDQFGDALSDGVTRATEVLPRLRDEYKRAYYHGIICERRGVSLLSRGGPGAAIGAYDWLREAMSWYERAEAMQASGNDEAILRWNTCARILARAPNFGEAEAERYEPSGFGE